MSGSGSYSTLMLLRLWGKSEQMPVNWEWITLPQWDTRSGIGCIKYLDLASERKQENISLTGFVTFLVLCPSDWCFVRERPWNENAIVSDALWWRTGKKLQTGVTLFYLRYNQQSTKYAKKMDQRLENCTSKYQGLLSLFLKNTAQKTLQ